MWTHGAHYLILVSGKSLPKPLGFFNIGAKSEGRSIRQFFCQVEAVETAIWLTEVAPHSRNEPTDTQSTRGLVVDRSN